MAEANPFPLPFQWDDGAFVAPFVATSEEQLEDVEDIIRRVLAARASLGQPSDSLRADLFVDLGCGDGRVVAKMCKAFNTDQSMCRMNGLGLDLDDELIDKAKELFPSPPQLAAGSSYTLDFKTMDLRECRGILVNRKATILYTYMLPDGIESVLKPLFLEVVEEWEKNEKYTASSESLPDGEELRLSHVDVIIVQAWEAKCISEYHLNPNNPAGKANVYVSPTMRKRLLDKSN